MSWKSGGRTGSQKGFAGFVSSSSSSNGRGGEYSSGSSGRQQHATSFNRSNGSGGGGGGKPSGFSGFVKAAVKPAAQSTNRQEPAMKGRAQRVAAAEWQEYKTEQVRSLLFFENSVRDLLCYGYLLPCVCHPTRVLATVGFCLQPLNCVPA